MAWEGVVGEAASLQALQVFKCLSDETRLMLVLLIAKEQSLCVCEMTYALEESQPNYYRLAPQLPAWAQSIIESAAQGSAVQLNALTQRLTRMGDRPARRAALC